MKRARTGPRRWTRTAPRPDPETVRRRTRATFVPIEGPRPGL
jgi:hypothetical protein